MKSKNYWIGHWIKKQKTKTICAAFLTLGALSSCGAGARKSVQTGPIAPMDEVEAAPTLLYLGRYNVTGYDTCEQCCGHTHGITASGAQATVGRTVSAGREFPIGTVLYIAGIGERIVEDRGNLNSDVLDVLCNNHSECYAITGVYDVYRVEEINNANV